MSFYGRKRERNRRTKGTGGIFQNGSFWWIKFYPTPGGKPKFESSKSANREDAEKLLRKRLGEVAVGKKHSAQADRIRMDALFDLVVADYREKGQRSIDDVKSRLKLHLRPKLGSLKAVELGTGDLSRYKAARQREGAGPATINRELSIIKRSFSLAAEHEPEPLVYHNPTVKKLTERNVRKGFIEKPDYVRLLAELPPYLKLALVIGFHTGARLNEVMSLRWSDVDLSRTEPTFTIAAEFSKNGEARSIPLYGDLLAALQQQKADRDEKYPLLEYVFHDGTGHRLKTFYKAWRSACTRAGLSGLLFHDLRRSAVRNMVRAGIDENLAMGISGHKTHHVFDRYNIRVAKDLANAGRQLAEYLAAQPAEPAPKPQQSDAQA
jgi:integrase